MRFQRTSTVCLLTVLCLALSCLSGCGKKQATVKGKVSFKGQPLTSGNIAFVDGGGRIAPGTIKSDGTYLVANVPVGEVTITVQTAPPMMAMMGMGSKPKKPSGLAPMPKDMIPADYQENSPDKKPLPVVPAPEKYNKVETSPLKYTVQSGTQEYNIDLNP